MTSLFDVVKTRKLDNVLLSSFEGYKTTRIAPRDFVDNIEVSGILVPLILGEWEGAFQLIAGNKRLDAARKVYQRFLDISDQESADSIAQIPVVIYHVHPEQHSLIAQIENFHRSDNEFTAYVAYQDAVKRGDVKAYTDIYKMSKNGIEKVRKLEELGAALPEWYEGTLKRLVTTNVVMEVAKLDSIRQKELLSRLRNGDKITAKVVKEIKSVQGNEALAGFFQNLPQIEVSAQQYVVFSQEHYLITENIAEARKAAKDTGEQIYQLVPVQ